MDLYTREYGHPDPGSTSILLLHGLFGSSANWHGIARRLEESRHVLVPDLRNHGRSAWDDVMDYPAMAGDLIALLDARGIDQAILVGHSMGGKVAMWLALHRPERVRALVPVDIAPVRYDHSFAGILRALESVPLDSLTNREEADRALAEHLETAALRAYLLQNLVKQAGRWAWRINLRALGRNMANIVGFPEEASGRPYVGDTLFVYGANSDYVGPEHAAAARQLFPFARMRVIPGAGHWVYSDEPEAFARALEAFLPGP
jgi:pimeloyl-ACP methyl ester carboxylesterase